MKKSRIKVDKKCEEINQLIVFMGMKRTGSSAISRFIYNLYDDPRVFINHNYDYDNDKKINCVLIKFEDIRFELKKIDKEIDYFNINNYKKLNYVLSLRDPYNMFASLLRHDIYGRRFDFLEDRLSRRRVIRRKKRINNFINKWKMYAREMLGDTNYIPDNKIFITYNQWYKCKNYRENIAKQLGVKSNDENWSLVSNNTQPSSFSGFKIKDARDMDVFSRWEKMKNSNFFQYIFKDEELYELSNRLFGKINGTEEFLK